MAVQTLAVGENQGLIESTVLRFVEEHYEFTARRLRVAKKPVDYLALWPVYAELGLLALPFGEEVGGVSGRFDDIAVVVAALGRGLVLEPFVEASVMAGAVLERLLPADSREDELAAIIGGEKIAILIDGRPGRQGGITYRRTGNGAVLDGRAATVSHGHEAGEWLVAATNQDTGAVAVFRLARGDTAALAQPYLMIDNRPAADISFNGCEVPAASLLAEGPAADQAVTRARQRGAAAQCAEAVGIMGALIEITGEYLKTRVQFGQPIGTFQALQHRFADMFIAYQEAFAIMKHTAGILSQDAPEGDAAERAALTALAIVGRASRHVGHEAIQLHGGIGATDELVVSHYNSRLVAIARSNEGPDAALVRLAALDAV